VLFVKMDVTVPDFQMSYLVKKFHFKHPPFVFVVQKGEAKVQFVVVVAVVVSFYSFTHAALRCIVFCLLFFYLFIVFFFKEIPFKLPPTESNLKDLVARLRKGEAVNPEEEETVEKIPGSPAEPVEPVATVIKQDL